MKSFSTREWVLIILSLLAIQFSIFSVSQEYKDYSEVLGYLSFAGTITSIVLAVVAIIYSFIQGEANQRSSESVFGQVEKLNTTSDKLVETGRDIGKQVKRYEELEKKLHELNEHIKETKRSVVESKKERDSIRNSIFDLRSAFIDRGSTDGNKFANSSADKESIKWVIKNRLEYSTTTMGAVAYILVCLYEFGLFPIKTDTIIVDLLEPALTQANIELSDEASDEISRAYKYLNLGAGFQSFRTLIALGAVSATIQEEEEIVNFQEEFLASIENLAKDVSTEGSENYEKIKFYIDEKVEAYKNSSSEKQE